MNCNDLKYYQVATAGIHIIETLEENLELIENSSAYILKVKCKSDIQFLFKQTYQEVEVMEVFQGKEDVKKGDIINIAPGCSRIFTENETINMGFVNKMRVDKEYLVFLGDKKTSIELDMSIYPTVEFIMTMIFAYDNIENIVVESGYVQYTVVENCEFFTDTKASIEKFLQIKTLLLEKYGGN